MTYQVLARKWRPRSFQEVVGQAPVVRALTNALDQQRLHHAYLFTGTRGVGKTTLARLLAKCLNCAQGVSSTPCGQCQPCQAIDQGRFLDLLEVDAASRTKVEDTRDLLDNVQYAPTQGRYKVYIIDEVHMLSNHSFNALLKTLEEPPPHAKFLLATTDPQRLPITVLSRCLQFHLKNLSIEQISKQLGMILDTEQLTYEFPALQQLAQAAAGSMRDALSLLDQAIAYGNGQVSSHTVKTLLGATEPELLLALLNSLAAHDAKRILQLIDELAESGIDFSYALEELLSLLHQIALEQTVPGAAGESTLHREEIATLAKQLSAEDVQLLYQIGLIGRRDLPLAPTPRSGFEMVLLRMLAFRPQTNSVDSVLKNNAATTAAPIPSQASTRPAPTVTATTPNHSNTPPIATAAPALATSRADTRSAPTVIEPSPTYAKEDWSVLLPQLNLQGAANVVASHCSLLQQTADSITLLLDSHHAALLNQNIEAHIARALEHHFQRKLHVAIKIGEPATETPAILDKKRQDQRQYQATEAITGDTHLQNLINQFSATIIPNSIKTKE